MLDRCFLHLPGLGPAFSRKLEQAGISCWQEALERPLPCGPARAGQIRAGLEESRSRLEANDARWFCSRLKPAEKWRLFPHFRGSAAYVDIESTGLGHDAAITSIALYDGQSVRAYVRGRNLEAFADDILDYSLLVTWNGRSFDAPFLRRELRIPLDDPASGHLAHLDLLPVFRALGLRGGLKKVERQLGMDRGQLDGVDGFMAVLLWQEFERSGDERALETLLAYNVADVLGLEALALYALDRHQGLEPLPGSLAVNERLNPFRAHPKLLRRLAGIRYNV